MTSRVRRSNAPPGMMKVNSANTTQRKKRTTSGLIAPISATSRSRSVGGATAAEGGDDNSLVFVQGTGLHLHQQVFEGADGMLRAAVVEAGDEIEGRCLAGVDTAGLESGQISARLFLEAAPGVADQS